jgi:hydrophobic/amphiphilic exporter-1 (mainly G- bacteria), HAE1 family
VVLLRDVATVRDAFEDRESMAKYNGQEAVGLLLFKDSEANTVRVSEEVDEVLAQLRAEYGELHIDVAMSQAGFIADAISNVVQALILGGLLAFLVLFLFLRDARYPVAIALAIPISVVGTFSLLDLAGVSLNIMSLGGLALGVGMLVDNSIVVLENIFRHRQLKAEGLEAATLDAAAVGAEEVQGAITASTLTTISVFAPILYVEGVAGELFAALSLAVAFSLLASLLVALTLLPTMAARWDLHQDDQVPLRPPPGPPRHGPRGRRGRAVFGPS